jgi:hypothetical protein
MPLTSCPKAGIAQLAVFRSRKQQLTTLDDG